MERELNVGSQPLRVPLVLVTVLLLHTTVLSQLRVAGVAPDVMLLLAVGGGLSGGPTRGGAFGFASGLAVDFFLETPLGLSALVFSLVGYSVGVAQTAMLRSAWWIPVLTALVASAAGQVLYAVTGTVVGSRPLVTSRLAVIVAVVAVGNAVLAVAVVRLVSWAFVSAPADRTYAA